MRRSVNTHQQARRGGGMDWVRLGAALDAVSRRYAYRHGFRRTDEWLMLKVAEEAGELVQWFLAASGQGRPRGKSPAELEDAVDDEIADVICHALLLAHHRGTDVQAVIDRKWLHRKDNRPEAPAVAMLGEDPDLPRAEVGEPVRIVERVPTVVEYRALRASVGWKAPAAAECESALAASLYSVVAEISGRAVGMARVIGDGVYAVVVDVVVTDGYQRCGIGGSLMDSIVGWATRSRVAHIGLVADDAVAGFYDRWPMRATGQFLRLDGVEGN